METKKYYEALRELNAKVDCKEAEYPNMCFATAISEGIELTENKIMKVLLNRVEDGYLAYEQALNLNKVYKELLLH